MAKYYRVTSITFDGNDNPALPDCDRIVHVLGEGPASNSDGTEDTTKVRLRVLVETDLPEHCGHCHR